MDISNLAWLEWNLTISLEIKEDLNREEEIPQDRNNQWIGWNIKSSPVERESDEED